jgi:adenylosuccinate synthase
MAKRAVQINGATQVALTKLDLLFPQCKGAQETTDLPVEAKRFISKIEESTGVPVTLIGTGADERDVIDERRRYERSPSRIRWAAVQKTRKSL